MGSVMSSWGNSGNGGGSQHVHGRGWQAASSPTTSEWRRDPAGHWHWIGPRQAQPPSGEKRLWLCRGCQCTNHSKAACTTCGMKRSYADAATAAQAPMPTPASTNKVRYQLNLVDTLLSQDAGLPAVATKTPPPTSAGGAPPAVAPAPSGAPARAPKEVKKQLEDALAALPDLPEMEAARKSLQEQLNQQVQLIRSSAPLGARLDGAMAALERAKKRRTAAEQAQQLAAQAVVDAQKECEALAADVEALQQAMASAPPAEEAPPATDLMSQLSSAVASALASLEGNSCVDPAHLQQAKEHSAKLVEGFNVTLRHAVNVQAAREAPSQRLTGKQSVGAPMPDVSDAKLRLVGKQPPKKVITDYFKASPKPIFRVVRRNHLKK